jgi:aldehyde dehydrogenase (NAD+)
MEQTHELLFIGGEWRKPAGARRIEVTSASTEQPLGYDDVDQAVAIANDSDYGLGGSVWTADPERGLDIARRVQTGSIGVNGYTLDPGSPFGGVKASGMGRELGPEGLAAFQQIKSIFLP